LLAMTARFGRSWMWIVGFENVFARYEARFGALPKLAHCRASLEECGRLMEQAIEDGKPLTPDDLARAQGDEPPVGKPTLGDVD
jgi:hypothetical protein